MACSERYTLSVFDSPTGKKARKWLWIGLAALVAVQMYFVQELLAALIMFTAVFAVLAVAAVVLFVIDRVGQRTIALVEPQTKQAAGQAAGFARRAWISAESNGKVVSKKLLHRLHSQTVR